MPANSTLSLGLIAGCILPPTLDGYDLRTAADVPLLPTSVSDSVLTTAAQDLGLPRSDLSLVRVNEETWTDSCLGVGLPHEACLQALVDGWQVEVVYNDHSWFYRTDATGDDVRQSYLVHNLPPSLINNALAAAATHSGVEKEQLEIFMAEPRDWNGCLGLERRGKACPQGVIYGWRVMVMSGHQLLVYHTDMIGDQIHLNTPRNGSENRPVSLLPYDRQTIERLRMPSD